MKRCSSSLRIQGSAVVCICVVPKSRVWDQAGMFWAAVSRSQTVIMGGLIPLKWTNWVTTVGSGVWLEETGISFWVCILFLGSGALSPSWSPCSVLLASCSPFLHVVLSHLRPRAMESTDRGPKLLNWEPNKLPLLQIFFSVQGKPNYNKKRN